MVVRSEHALEKVRREWGEDTRARESGAVCRMCGGSRDGRRAGTGNEYMRRQCIMERGVRECDQAACSNAVAWTDATAGELKAVGEFRNGSEAAGNSTQTLPPSQGGDR